MHHVSFFPFSSDELSVAYLILLLFVCESRFGIVNTKQSNCTVGSHSNTLYLLINKSVWYA